MEAKTTSPKETQKIAQILSKELEGGDIIALFGDLGTGKTIFVQGLAKGLGIKRRITSPTFVFMRSYQFTKKDQPLTFYHLDLYRGESTQDFKSLGLEEIFSKESIVVLEWAEKIKDILPKNRTEVYFSTIDENTRKISIKRHK